MVAEVAVKEDIKPDLRGVNEGVWARLNLFKDQSGYSLARIASMMNRSTAAISQYINRKYPGNIPELEQDIESLLNRRESLEFVEDVEDFCNTRVSTLMWEVLQFCDVTQKMGAVLAPSGSGKSKVAAQYKKRNRATILMTADITKTRPGIVIRKIAALTGVNNTGSTSALLDTVVERLRGSKRLLVIDDAHFLSWEAFEGVRKIHDCARIGVVYMGQERLYEQMKGQSQRAYLFDQIYRRIVMKRDKFKVTKGDTQKIAETICPGLDGACMDYLHGKAVKKGRFGNVDNLLHVAMEMHKNYQKPLDVNLLMEADRFLLNE